MAIPCKFKSPFIASPDTRVETTQAGVIFRTFAFQVSAAYTFPEESTAIPPYISLNFADPLVPSAYP